MGTSDIGRHKYKLQRAANTTTKSALADNLLLAQLVEGDSIVVSTEAGHHALAIGFVIELGERDLIIAVDRRCGVSVNAVAHHFTHIRAPTRRVDRRSSAHFQI